MMLIHTWTHCVRVTIQDNDRTTTTIPGTHSDGAQLSTVVTDIQIRCIVICLNKSWR